MLFHYLPLKITQIVTVDGKRFTLSNHQGNPNKLSIFSSGFSHRDKQKCLQT